MVCLGHDTLANHFETNFALMNHRQYDLGQLDNMIPYEREIYLAMLVDFLEQERQKALNGG